MSFPALGYPQVKYARTALRTVVCQLRFNTILKISQVPPAGFQERIRHEFPRFGREEAVEVQIALSEAAEVVPPAVQALQRPGTWRFQTEDGSWTASLGTDFIALETSAYNRFADFDDRFAHLSRALEEEYGVDHYVRVGLRYINVFTPQDFPGAALEKFNPALLGPMADEMLGNLVTDSKQLFVLAADGWTINVRHGTDPAGYRLDIDHATEEKVVSAEVRHRLGAFNERAYEVFRWAISESLHEQMEPRIDD